MAFWQFPVCPNIFFFFGALQDAELIDGYRTRFWVHLYGIQGIT